MLYTAHHPGLGTADVDVIHMDDLFSRLQFVVAAAGRDKECICCTLDDIFTAFTTPYWATDTGKVA